MRRFELLERLSCQLPALLGLLLMFFCCGHENPLNIRAPRHWREALDGPIEDEGLGGIGGRPHIQRV